MKLRILLNTFLLGIMAFALSACVSRKPASNPVAQWRPWTNEVASAEQMSRALEERWTLERIRACCRESGPTPPNVQNLLIMGERWEGSLHRNTPSEFDRLWWSATVEHGELSKYSVNAKTGSKFWIV